VTYFSTPDFAGFPIDAQLHRAETDSRCLRLVSRADVVNGRIFFQHFVDFDEPGVGNAGGEIHAGFLEPLDYQLGLF
jgi:hypothetical protein